MSDAPLSGSERKILAAVRAHPGLRWYEVGAIAYPGSCKQRINIAGKPFSELSGIGLSLTHDAITSLTKAGLIKADADFRYEARHG